MKIFRRNALRAIASLSIALPGYLISLSAHAAQRTVTIAYQTGAIPYAVGIQDGSLARQTGWHIDFRRFNSGAEIFAAIAGGSVDIGDVGSSPLAASLSNGLDVKVVYVSSGAGRDEQLIVRNGSGIKSLSDLRGKRLAAAPVSTDHYMLLSVLKQEGIKESEVRFYAIPQPQIVAGWARGDIDAAFVWNPALNELLKSGRSVLTAEQVAKRGAPTFSALVSTTSFAEKNPGFLRDYLKDVDGYFVSFREHPSDWSTTSDNAKKLAALLGGTPEQQATDLTYPNFPSESAQLSPTWLEGGADSGIAKALKSTSEFLKEQGKIGETLPSYGTAVTTEYLAPKQALQN
jgi:taurine transport system substrate-binding protein